jgi:FkbM family methyltransferase
MDIAKLLLRIRPVELAEMLKGILRISYREVRVGERTFWLDPASNFGSRLIAEGSYEKDMSNYLSGLLKPGDVFVDLGANEGYFSILASELVGETGRAFAVEPQARLWPVILRNAMLNGRTNVILVPYAIGLAKGFIDLELYPSINTGASSAVRGLRRLNGRTQNTATLPMEQLLGDYGIKKAKVIKIDVEGFELNVLRSMGGKLREGVFDNILLEVHPGHLRRLGQSEDDVYSLLEQSGYRRVFSGEFEHWVR